MLEKGNCAYELKSNVINILLSVSLYKIFVDNIIYSSRHNYIHNFYLKHSRSLVLNEIQGIIMGDSRCSEYYNALHLCLKYYQTTTGIHFFIMLMQSVHY